ncbi:hypothetical protein EDB84DRAFT_1146746 [Lactarius hengduanensis]|nr:hypothetical protein EDB84DRAFT_1146746 [Lactarius hengduanensis]
MARISGCCSKNTTLSPPRRSLCLVACSALSANEQALCVFFAGGRLLSRTLLWRSYPFVITPVTRAPPFFVPSHTSTLYSSHLDLFWFISCPCYLSTLAYWTITNVFKLLYVICLCCSLSRENRPWVSKSGHTAAGDRGDTSPHVTSFKFLTHLEKKKEGEPMRGSAASRVPSIQAWVG